MDTYRVQHTAQCKLHLHANRKDRNLRFLLGHALTLDNVTLRIMEIENQKAKAPVEEDPSSRPGHGRRISFQDNNARPSNVDSTPESRRRAPSPPPNALDRPEEDLEEDEDSSDDEYDDDGEDEYAIGGASLQRFGSAAAQPPRLVEDDDEDDDNYDGPVSPPELPSDFDFTAVTSQAPDEQLTELYNSVSTCRCHGKATPKASSAWPLPSDSDGGRRLALVRVGS